MKEESVFSDVSNDSQKEVWQPHFPAIPATRRRPGPRFAAITSENMENLAERPTFRLGCAVPCLGCASAGFLDREAVCIAGNCTRQRLLRRIKRLTKGSSAASFSSHSSITQATRQSLLRRIKRPTKGSVAASFSSHSSNTQATRRPGLRFSALGQMDREDTAIASENMENLAERPT
eukprot:s635_g10.t1